jgi:hypothetical protein
MDYYPHTSVAGPVYSRIDWGKRSLSRINIDRKQLIIDLDQCPINPAASGDLRNP